MKKFMIILFTVIICFVLQCSIFPYLAFASIAPNLLVILTASFGFMRGKKEGMIIGFVCGLLFDIFCGNFIGFYALLYMYIGYANGYFQKIFFPEDIKLPLILVSASDIFANIMVYFFQFLFRGKFDFQFYLMHIIIPEWVYTLLIMIFLYFILLKINQKLENVEKRGTKKGAR